VCCPTPPPAGALARALLGDPRVPFLDEPTSGLDPLAAHDVHELIDGLRSPGVTIFVTTHRLDEAERLCDRVAILNTTLRTIGSPNELREWLFAKTLTVRTAHPLADPDRVLGGRMLAMPATVPAMVAAYSVAGERAQGTLEPVLTTPIRREELLLGKALAALAPALAVSYFVLGVFLTCIRLFADPAVAAAVIRSPELVAELLFTPLVLDLGGHRRTDPLERARVAAQLGVVASFPAIMVTTIVSLGGNVAVATWRALR
jgi:hypothetical protein